MVVVFVFVFVVVVAVAVMVVIVVVVVVLHFVCCLCCLPGLLFVVCCQFLVVHPTARSTAVNGCSWHLA